MPPTMTKLPRGLNWLWAFLWWLPILTPVNCRIDKDYFHQGKCEDED